MSSNTNSNQERDTFTDSVVSNETTTDNDAAVNDTVTNDSVVNDAVTNDAIVNDAVNNDAAANDTSDSVNPADAETSKKKKKKKHEKPQVIPMWKIILLLVSMLVVSLLTSLIFWALSTWEEINMDEVLWHLKTSLKGTQQEIIDGAVKVAVLGMAAIFIPALIILLKTRKRGKTGRIVYHSFQCLTVIVLIVGLVVGYHGFNINNLIKSHFVYSSFIEQEYVDPGSVKITFPEKKRNLIFIYMESMELTFMDEINGGAFDENVIPELTTLARENESFSGNKDILNGGISLPCTVWTMGAVFGSTCGLPLKTPLGQNGMSAKDDFCPGIINMGDILEKEGYRNVLVMGSDAEFGGCKHYFESHGNFEIHDYVYAKETGLIPPNYLVWWGYEDEKLFEFAKGDLTELAAGDQPFQLVIQTMDTHFEDGHTCRLCDDKFGDNVYANVMNCSSRMVSSFVKWIQDQDFYENTTIIITGDHPTMDKDFCENVPDDYQRKVFTCIINPAVTPANPDAARTYSTIDLFPTTIASLGATIEGERLGLGTNLFSKKETLIEEYGQKNVEKGINRGSKLMERMFNGIYSSPSKKVNNSNDDK